jgi:DNA (cytosine-5)-methyltransferase 1
VILLENVEEFRTWGPLDKDGRIIKSQKGTTFRAFVNALRALGYRVDWRELRACDYGAPTIRNRLFMIARCDGLSITWPELTHGPRRALPYRTAADIIDWTIPCPSIFDRRKPLAEATLRRIAAGIKRYVLGAADPFIISIDHRGSGDGSIRSMGDPLTTITRKNRHALVTAFLAKHYGGVVGQDVVFPIGTITTVDHHGLVTANLTRFHGKSVGSDLTEAMPTVMGHAKDGLISSHLVKLRGTCRDGQGVKVPMPTITSGGLHVGEVRAFLMKYYGTGGQLQSCSSPMHTIPTRDRMGLVTVRIGGEPYVIADIGMRMLTPRELFRAQGFPDSYRIDIDVDGRRISKADQVRMCGNSVCPQVAEVLVRKNMERAKLSNSMQSTEYFQLNMLGNV